MMLAEWSRTVCIAVVTAVVLRHVRGIQFKRGIWLEELPGYAEIHRTTPRTFVNISMVGEDFQGPHDAKDEELMLQMKAFMYRNDDDGTTYTFGPTVRASAGDVIYINLTNTFARLKGESVVGNVPNGYKLPSYINLHPHGLHTLPNPSSQPDSGDEIDGGDAPAPDESPDGSLEGRAGMGSHTPSAPSPNLHAEASQQTTRAGPSREAHGELYGNMTKPHHSQRHKRHASRYSGSKNWFSMQLRYGGGDNVMARIPPRESEADPPNYLTYNFSLPFDHMPGMAWYHPHSHGATTYHVMSAKGVIIIEDDPDYLPDSEGCIEIREALMGHSHMTERILILELWAFDGSYFFANNGVSTAPERLVVNPAGSNLTGPAEAFVYDSFDDELHTSDDSYISVSEGADINPGNDNPFCCVTNRTGIPFKTDNMEFLTINGGFQPKIRMTEGVWQRWRVLNSAIYKFVDLTITKADGSPAPCRMGLLAKDGVYIMEIPRSIDHVLLPAAGRSELVIQCDLPSPDPLDPLFECLSVEYYLASGYGPTRPSSDCGANHCLGVTQKKVATLTVYPRRTAKHLDDRIFAIEFPERGCKPLRPSYAPDLRDEALAAAGVTEPVLRHDVLSLIQTEAGCNVMGRDYAWPTKYPILLEIGTVQEWLVPTVNVHPMHLHISPHQIVSLPDYDNATVRAMLTSYFEPGDWHDTLFLPALDWSMGFASIRMQPGPFAGYSVLHCHILQHADEGCQAAVLFGCPNTPDPQPKYCPGFKWPVNGTYGLPDLDDGDETARSRLAIVEMLPTNGRASATGLTSGRMEASIENAEVHSKSEARLLAAIAATRAGDA